ncbi:MAG: Trk system potassium transporter TrkA [Myxococcales bacterium]|nr:Trk system potassium transporter TrkA [Myxococcales bacterium]MCB9629033.1 Trk system potassium transporter TrkA [Sandaracinaceae bacterium]
MYIVVIGLGEVGRHLLSVLDHEGHDVVAVDASPEAVAYAEEHYDVASILGYGASQDVLDRAGVARADIVVAVSNHDEVNLIAALAAKQLGAKQAVARAQGDEWANWTEGIRYGLLGVDVVINPRVLVAQELARVARSHGASDVIDLSQDRVELVQIELAGESRLFNKALKSIDMPSNALVAAIVRDGVLEVPGGDDVFQKGDRVYLIGSPDGVLAAERLFSRTREARRVCIVGGGVVGKSLARELKRSGAKVMLIEKDRDTAESISIELEGIDVVHGDGTHQGLLEEEEVDTYDLFCAVTAMDEVNLMASLLAKRIGCHRTAVTVQRADYVPIYKQLGIDIVLSPRTVASDHILRLSRGGVLHSLTVLENGQAEVVELTVSSHSPAVGRELTKMRDLLPHGALLGAIIHGERVVIPRGSTKLAAGDRVIVMTKSHARKAVERLFRPRHS